MFMIFVEAHKIQKMLQMIESNQYVHMPKASPFLRNLDLSKLKPQRKSTPRKPYRTYNRVRFPSKLYKLLSDVEMQDQESILSWQPDGKSFKIHNHEVFVSTIIPSYFKMTNYKSFQKQLSVYGFRRISSGPFEGSYYHPKFVHGNEDLCKEMMPQPESRKKPSPTIQHVSSTATQQLQPQHDLNLQDESILYEHSRTGFDILCRQQSSLLPDDWSTDDESDDQSIIEYFADNNFWFPASDLIDCTQ